MYDINFYMKIHELGILKQFSKKELQVIFEKYRSKYPVIYNIETTNACNMRCKMCPRTIKMTRPIKQLNSIITNNIIGQLKPHDPDLWKKWEEFCTNVYNIGPNDGPSENHFFLHIIPKVIQLHGYGDPLLDKNLPNIVRLLTKYGFESYFSCNPANIDIEKTVKMMELGLNYIKYSFESVDDIKSKDIRGNAANFTDAYEKTLEILKIKKEKKLNTTIVITMIDINGVDQIEEFEKLKLAFKKEDVYIYLKSEDQQWFRSDKQLHEYLNKHGREIPKSEKHQTLSIHWTEICKHPWMSMTIKSDGLAVMCMEDYNNEIILGDAKIDSLYDIWNGQLYDNFRKDHFNLTKNIKCTEECDMPKVGDQYA